MVLTDPNVQARFSEIMRLKQLCTFGVILKSRNNLCKIEAKERIWSTKHHHKQLSVFSKEGLGDDSTKDRMRETESRRERSLSRIIGFVLAVPPGLPASLNKHTINAGCSPVHLICPFFIKEKSLLGISICRWPCPNFRGTGGGWCPERESHQCELGVAWRHRD